MDGRLNRNVCAVLAAWLDEAALCAFAQTNRFFYTIAQDEARKKLRDFVGDDDFNELINRLHHPRIVWLIWRLFKNPRFRRRSQLVLDPFWFARKDPFVWYCMDDDLASLARAGSAIRDYLPLAIVFHRTAITHFFLKSEPLVDITQHHAKWYFQSALFSGSSQMLDWVCNLRTLLNIKWVVTHETLLVAANSRNPVMVQIAREMASATGDAVFLNNNLRIKAGLVDAQVLLAKIKALPAINEYIFRVTCMQIIMSERVDLLRDFLSAAVGLPWDTRMTIREVDYAASTGNGVLFNYVLKLAHHAQLRPTSETLEKAILSGSLPMVRRVHAWALKTGVRYRFGMDQLVAALKTGQEDLYEYILSLSRALQPTLELLHAAIMSGNERLLESVLAWSKEVRVVLRVTDASLLAAIYSRNPGMLRWVFACAVEQGVTFTLERDNLLLAEPKRRSPSLLHHLIKLWPAAKTPTPQ